MLLLAKMMKRMGKMMMKMKMERKEKRERKKMTSVERQVSNVDENSVFQCLLVTFELSEVI